MQFKFKNPDHPLQQMWAKLKSFTSE
jgi:hypothetical protein